MLITDIPKSVAVGTPTDVNRWLASEANQVIDEFQNLLDDTDQTKSASDLFQASKAVARYVFGNTLVENNGTSTHGGAADIYIVERDGGDSKKIPAVLLRGVFSVKILNTNQSNNVSLQLGTTTEKELKKFDMAGNLTEIPVGEFRADDIVFIVYDSDDDVYIVKKAFSNDEVQNVIGKFNILNFLDFTASAPVAGGTIGDRYINTTTGVISAGTIGAVGTAVTIHKIYELYDVTGAYNWREIDPQDGDLVFDDNSKTFYHYNGTSWTNEIITDDITTDNLTINYKLTTTQNSTVLVSDAITYIGINQLVDTEGSAPTDDLSTINGGVNGDIIIIKTVDGTRDTTIKHNVGNILTITRTDLILDSVFDVWIGQYNGSSWVELSRAIRVDPGSPKILLETQTASADATIDFVTGISSIYKNYLIEFTDVKPATDDVVFEMLVSENAGGAWKVGATDYGFSNFGYSSAGANSYLDNANTFMALSEDGAGLKLGNAANESYCGEITIYNPSGTTNIKKIGGNVTYDTAGGAIDIQSQIIGGKYYGSNNAINGFRFSMSAGNIASGLFKLYGLN